MPNRTGLRPVAALVALLTLAGTAAGSRAAAEQVSFDVYLLGVRAGTLTYAFEESPNRYALSGLARSAGVVGLFSDLRVEAQTIGRKTAAGYVPERYTEVSVGSSERSSREIRYAADGTPRLRSAEPREPHWLPEDRQAGTLDPMTTIYELLRDRPGTSPCVLDALFADGARMGRISATPGRMAGETATCAGLYERKGGFSAKQLEDGTEFPFTMSYARNGAVWELTEVRIDSRMGRAQFVRR